RPEHRGGARRLQHRREADPRGAAAKRRARCGMKRALPLVLALLMFAVGSVLWIVTDRRALQRVYDVYSSANTSKDGLSLAAGYLAKKRKVEMLTRPLGREPIERNAVVFRVAEEMPRFFDPEDLDPKQFGPPRPKRLPLLNEKDEA